MTASDPSPDAGLWLGERPRLLGLAYTVTGSWQDAEDVVSEAWLRLDREHRAGRGPDTPEAWLTTVVSRLALDSATSAASRRETYVGPWLPETVLEDAVPVDVADSPQDLVVLGEQVDLAFVRLLQQLNPVDRVIVVLAEVAGLPHAGIAAVVGTTASATRQRLRRARASLATDRDGDPGGLPVTADRAALDRLASSLNDGDLQVLVEQLSEGCVLWTDSGGLTRAARNPVRGTDKVARFLAGLIAKYGMPRLSVVDAVGGPVLYADSADMTRIITPEFTGGRVTGIQIQQNPEKILRR